jgi:ubiquinone/menaquinone biosynthesis C-methylase UbiE
VGRWEQGIARFGVFGGDPSIGWYQAIGGTHFHERMSIPFTMSSLDAPVYHAYLENLKPESPESVIVDVGAGDGRNTAPWLEWGYHRVLATDAVVSSLARFRSRISEEHPEWVDRLLLVEADARCLPVRTVGADLVLAIEILCYMNEDYALGLSECSRILKRSGRLLVSERSWEGGLLTRLLYGGVEAIVQMADNRDLWDGYGDQLVRSRTFTEEEFVATIELAGLTPLERKGLSVLPLIFGYVRQQDRLLPEHQQHLSKVRDLLRMLGEKGKMRRTHVIVARHTA